MKVIVVRSRSTDQAINKYCKTLTENGYEVDLLVWDRKNNLEDSNFNEGYKIYPFRLNAPLDNCLVAFYLPFWWMYVFYFLLMKKSDIVHLSDMDTLIPGIFIKCFKRVKIVYTIFDFYADNFGAINFQPLSYLLCKIVESTEIFFIKFCDLLTIVDESRLAEVRGAKINNVIYLYNSPPDIITEKTLVIKPPPQQINIFYTGLISRMRGIQYMIESIQNLADVKLTLGGYLVNKDIFPEDLTNIRNVEYLGWIPSYSRVLELTMRSDLLFRFSDPRHPKTKNESPNKLFEAMMCGKPIIVSDHSSMADIVKNEKCGIVIPFGDVKAIQNAIEFLRNNPELYLQFANNGRKAYVEKYSWNIMAKRLIDAYNQL